MWPMASSIILSVEDLKDCQRRIVRSDSSFMSSASKGSMHASSTRGKKKKITIVVFGMGRTFTCNTQNLYITQNMEIFLKKFLPLTIVSTVHSQTVVLIGWQYYAQKVHNKVKYNNAAVMYSTLNVHRHFFCYFIIQTKHWSFSAHNKYSVSVNHLYHTHELKCKMGGRHFSTILFFYSHFWNFTELISFFEW